MINKLGTVEEESDESVYWMELLVEAEVIRERKLAALLKEGNEILAMTTASIRTLRGLNN